MTENELVVKYGDVSLSFSSLYKHRAYYKGIIDGQIIQISAAVDYRDEISAGETIGSLCQLEYVDFSLQPIQE